MDTPVPIPNTEVKHRNGEGIRKGRIASCRAFFLFTMLYIKNKIRDFIVHGADNWIWTSSLFITSELLYRWSYVGGINII